MIDYPALKESFVDTALATPLNLVLNWIFLSLFLSWGWGAVAITVGMTSMFFVVAVVRKYYVRQYFKRNDI